MSNSKDNIIKWARLWNQIEALIEYREKKDLDIDISLRTETQLFRKLLDEAEQYGK